MSTITAPGSLVPSKPDWKPIQAIHRGNDGYITFARKDEEGNHQELWAIQAQELEGVFPQLLPELEVDSYFSINSFYRGAHWHSKTQPALRPVNDKPLLGTERRISSLRHLTACFVDIDCYEKDVTQGQVLGAVDDAVTDGHLPAPSMIARTPERGVWCFWFLVGPEGSHTLQRAFPEKIQMWNRIQNVLCNKLDALGTDAGAKDAARLTRVPGSINTKANARIACWFPVLEDGTVPKYTLYDLAKFFNVFETPGGPALKRFEKKTEGKEGLDARRGQRGRWRHALRDFQTLWSLRGTWRKGLRNKAAFVLSNILRGIDDFGTDADRWDEMLRLLRDMEQPLKENGRGVDRYSIKDLERVWKQIGIKRQNKKLYYKTGLLRNQTIADLLDITPIEQAQLKKWPCASAYKDLPEFLEAPAGGRAKMTLVRSWMVKQICDEHTESKKKIPTLNELKDLLLSHGVQASVSTIRQDMKDLGIANPRRHGRKRLKSANSEQRKLFG